MTTRLRELSAQVRELEVEQIRSLSKLPSRDVLYEQLVGVVASPIGGLVRSLGALVGGLAVALGQVNEKKQSGEIPAGEAPAAAAPSKAEPESDEPAQEDDNEADVSAEAQPEDAETNPPNED